MTHRIKIKNLLNKLGQELNLPERMGNPFAIENSQQQLSIYKSLGAWPGSNYLLIGNSYRECLLIGTDLESQRAGCFTVMLAQSKGCISVEDAFAFDGFLDVLSSAEHSWLTSLPCDVLLGPAYDHNGRRLKTWLAVWQRQSPTQSPQFQVETRIHA